MFAEHSATASPDSTLKIIDVGSMRADLSRRRELKFALPNADLRKLGRLLEGNGRRQIFNNAVSTVYSVYFDDSRLSTCHANIDGLGRRNKVRVRWYDTREPGHEVFFEIKWRDNLVTGKHRFQVRSLHAIHALSYREIVSSLEAALPERYRAILAKFCEPTLLVRYQREHFVSSDGKLRATVDYNITYFDQTGKRRMNTSFGRSHDGLVVLEGKMAVGRESELRTLLYPFSARVGRSSKYVDGCLMLGLVRA